MFICKYINKVCAAGEKLDQTVKQSINQSHFFFVLISLSKENKNKKCRSV